jgi:hypothetical protein
MTDTEDLLTETFTSREHRADSAVDRLLPAVRRGTARRRQRRLAFQLAGAAGMTLVVVVGVVVTVNLNRADRQPPPPPTAYVLPSGWRWESSLGIEAAVPGQWDVNNTGCLQTNAPTVVRGQESSFSCLTPEPPDKEIAIFATRVAPPESAGEGPAPTVSGRTDRDILISGVPATRAEARLSDGRYTGWLDIPSRQVVLTVRTHDPATMAGILDSVRLVVGADHAGCPPQREAETAPASPRSTFVMDNPDTVSVCFYGDINLGGFMAVHRDDISASGQLNGDAARQLAAALNQSPAGGNPDTTGCPPELSAADAVLYRRGPAGEDRVWVSWTGCTGRGISNGARQAQVSETIVRAVMRPVQLSFGLAAGIPK